MQGHQVKLTQVRDGGSLNESGGNRNREKEYGSTALLKLKQNDLEAVSSSGKERKKLNMTLRVSLGRQGEDSWMMDKEWFAGK